MILLSLFSCQRIYFDTAMPTDGKNLYKFPKSLRGTWKSNGGTVEITGEFLSIRSNIPDTISLTKALDKDHFVLTKDKIYEVKDKDPGLSQGFDYIKYKDSIIYQKVEDYRIILGSEAFIRQVDNHYLVHLVNENWFEILMLEVTDNKDIVGYMMQSGGIKKSDSLSIIHKDRNNYYVHSVLNKDKVNNLIKAGGFERMFDTLYHNERIRH